MTNQQPSAPSQLSAAELLQFYLHAGVDIALEDEPVNQFEQFKKAAAERREKLAAKAAKPTPPAQSRTPQTPSANPANQSGSASIPDEAAIADARKLAATATSLENLREILSDFKGCNLRLSAKSLVFGAGNPQAKIMLVGEAPGRDEDLHGLPFVGRSGQLLEKMLAAIGLTRDEVYISNVIPWRPPGNRTPTPQETEICRPFIERHIELVNPQILILLGGASAKTLLNTSEGILRLRGKWSECKLPNATIQTLPTLHPAYLLRQPAQKKLAWQDLLKVKMSMK